MNPTFVEAVCVSTMCSQVWISGVSKYQHVFEIRVCSICAVDQESVQIESKVTVHRLYREWRTLIATAVVSVKSTSYPEPDKKLPQTFILITKSMNVSEVLDIKYSRSSDPRGDRFLHVLYRLQHRRLNQPVRKDSEITVYKRNFRTRHYEV